MGDKHVICCSGLQPFLSTLCCINTVPFPSIKVSPFVVITLFLLLAGIDSYEEKSSIFMVKCLEAPESINHGVRGTLKFHHSDSATHVTVCNSCNSVWSSTWKVAPSHSTYWSLSMCHILSILTILFPFLFLCLAIAILLHLHLDSHTISNTSCISYSSLIPLPWSAAGCYALCSLCSPLLLGSP